MGHSPPEKTNRHWHQLGNDRVTAIAANEGWIQIHSHESGPRINMYRPDRQSYAGGISFIQIGDCAFSTMYRSLSKEATVERVWGCSYSRFRVEHWVCAWGGRYLRHSGTPPLWWLAFELRISSR